MNQADGQGVRRARGHHAAGAVARIRLGVLGVGLLIVLATSSVRGATALGDWGHFLSYHPRMHLYNPDGRSFSVSVHIMQWGLPGWNRATHEIRLTAPDGTVLHEGQTPLRNAMATIEVPAGVAGTYLLEPKGNAWIASSLDRSVLWTGLTTGHMVDDRRACFQAVVPRRWWFWVPADVTSFTARAQRADRYMSQREEWGFFIVTPRGQRIRALWGQPPHADVYRQEQVVAVPVEPGAAGRFWSLDVGLGDSHDYSNINISLEGVPPYLARSPEEWFNPETGKPADVALYDDTPFMQSARTDAMSERWPLLEHFSPCPSLGDPDGIHIIGDGRFAISNPEDRELGLRVGAYLPRQPKEAPSQADVTIVGPAGKTVFEKSLPILHVHGAAGHPSDTIRTGKGVSTVQVRGTERWLAFTYPATPLVLLGEAVGDGWMRYRFTVCAQRHWYFMVPEGATEFQIRMQADLDTDVVHLDVCAPDRTMAILYDRAAERTVQVPDGLDGRIWFLRPSVGSASRLITEAGPAPRYQNIRLTLDLKGTPNGLAPTWEQWFDWRER